MRRKTLCFIIAGLVIGLSGCSGSESEMETVPAKTEDYDISTIPSEKIVSVSCGEADYATLYPDLSSLAETSAEIIYGEIKDLDYEVRENGICVTYTEVEVLDPIKGSFATGDTVRISESQGIATVEEFLNSFEIDALKEQLREGYAEYDGEELKDIYIQQLDQNDIMVEKGQRNVYFLEKSARYETEHTYCRITGPESSFTEIGEDTFARTDSLGAMASQNYRLNTLNLNGEISTELKTYSLEELVNQMNLVSN